MEPALEAVRLALEPDASQDARGAGIAACRAILGVLDPLQPPTPPQRSGATIDVSQVAALVGALRGVPPEQLLDLVISKLRAALPTEPSTPAQKGIAFHLVAINR